MRLRSFLFVVATAATFTTAESAAAENLSYTYAQLRYADVEVDQNSLDGNGFLLSGSYRLNSNYFVFGGYQDIDFDFSRDGSSLRAGGGYIHTINDGVHAVGKVFLARAKASRPGFSANETGFGIEVGLRSRVSQKLEARGFLSYSDIGGTDTSVTLAGDYYFSPRLSAGLTANLGGDVTGFSVGARYYFDD